MKFKLFLAIASTINLTSGLAQNIDSLLSSTYFTSGIVPFDTGGFSFSDIYTPSTSSWAIDSFPESVVFQSQLEYANPQDTNESYQIRIGKGGHLYSFRSSFGESVPPQWRPQNWVQPSYGGGTSYAPWVDEVWQMVCVDGALNNPPDSSYFIHQSGVYLKTPEQTQPFFSPTVADYFDPVTRSYSIVNWGQHAHTEDLLATGFTSSLLYYTKYTDLGSGVLQVDNMIYNFGNDNISFLNIPWGGVRNSSLDHFFISGIDHSYVNSPGLYGQTPVVQTASTGGWMAWSNDSLGNSQSIGMAHPVSTNTNGNVFRYGDAGNLSNPNHLRDYNVFEMIRFPAPGQLGFGRSMSFRYFYVLGANIESIKSTIVDNGLVQSSLDTAFTPDQTSVDSVWYQIEANGSNLEVSLNSTNSGLLVSTSPYINSFPLFLLTSSSGQVISSNPYHFSNVAYDGTTESIRLLGFLDNQTSVSIVHDTVCYGDNFILPDSVLLQNVESSMMHVSTLSSIQGEWDSLVVTNLNVKELDLEVINSGSILTSSDMNSAYQWLDCASNMSQISGETNQWIESLNPGEFAVQLSSSGCIDTTECYLINPVTLNGSSLINGFKLSPNPTHDYIQIEFESVQQQLRISVSDITGQLISEHWLVNSDRIEIFLDQEPGTYLVDINDQNGNSAAVKLIKN